MKRLSAGWVLAAIGVAALALIPALTSSGYYIQIMTQLMIFAALFTALDIAVGQAGLISGAHGALFGLGAYATGILTSHSGWGFWATLPVAMLLGAVCGLLVGALTLRLEGHYFVIATLCFGIVVTIVIRNWSSLTNGDLGISPIPAPEAIGPLSFSSGPSFYYLCVVLAVVVSVGTYALMHSSTGQRLRAVRDNPGLASALGTDVARVRLVVFVVSAVLASLAGSFQASNLAFISPSISAFDIAVTAVLAIIIGGRATVAGPYVGAAIFVVLPELLRSADEFRLILMGSLLIVTIIFAPDGVVGRIKAGAAHLWAKANRVPEPAGEAS